MGLLIKLLNGDTTLKSLKYGKDQLGGADSNQPFIQTPIGEPEQSGLASSDFILRGGITAPTHAAIDILRLSKFFITPKGLGFITKQNILSRNAVKTEVGGFLNEGVYNPLSTLAQAGVGFLGGHLEKQGLIPGISRKTYEEAIKTQTHNRLEELITLINDNNSQNNFNFIKNYGLNIGNDIVT